MNSRQRMDAAMRCKIPDRVPVMCQLTLGHYFLHAGLDPIEIWHSSEAFGEALILMQRRYGFDGILVNLPGRDPEWRHAAAAIEKRDGERAIRWKNGWVTVVPTDDLPHTYREDGAEFHAELDQVDPETLFYVEPYDLGGLKHPQAWGFAAPGKPGPGFFPPWQTATLRYVLERVGEHTSVHAEVFSPFSQFMDLFGYTGALLALLDDASKVKACLERLSEGTIELGGQLAAAGAHAILLSSAFAGAGLISRQHYAEFVMPYEKKVIRGIRARRDLPIYTHSCGAIGDRLDLMEATGTNGIDTLDPPPLGTVEIADAKRALAGRLFLKGNIDPVNTLLNGKPEDVLEAARERIRLAGPGGGYILSSACSVPPYAPPQNILALREAVERFGWYSSRTPRAEVQLV